MQLHIPREQPHVPECVSEVPELLVAQGFDGRRVDGSGHMFLGQGDGVFSYHCLPSRRVSCNKDRVVLLQVQDGLLLKHIWFKRPLCEREMDRAAGRSLSASSKACRATRKRPVQGWDQGARLARKGCGLWAEGRDQAYQEVE